MVIFQVLRVGVGVFNMGWSLIFWGATASVSKNPVLPALQLRLLSLMNPGHFFEEVFESHEFRLSDRFLVVFRHAAEHIFLRPIMQTYRT